MTFKQFKRVFTLNYLEIDCERKDKYNEERIIKTKEPVHCPLP